MEREHIFGSFCFKCQLYCYHLQFAYFIIYLDPSFFIPQMVIVITFKLLCCRSSI
jgi:hypothetical protein